MSLSFEITGRADAPAVAVLGGISASKHVTATAEDPAPGWWPQIVGAGHAIDTNRWRVISIDYLPYSGADRPVSTREQADALAAALDAAGVDRVRAVVGASYGGMVALAFGAAHPERTDHLIVIGAAHESDPMATALRVLQRRVVALGMDTGRSGDALIIARGVAMTAYGTPDEFRDRCARNGHAGTNGVAENLSEYLTAGGERFASMCSPERFVALSRSLDDHFVRPEDVRVPTTVVAVHGDQLVPISQARELAARLGASCRLVELRSIHGHDTFLNDPHLLTPVLEEELCGARADRPPEVTKGTQRAATRAVRAGVATDEHHGAVIPPLHLSSTFSFAGFGRKRAYDYTRSGNPTRDHLAVALAELEGGVASVVTSSGMSAVALVLQLVRPGELVLAAHDCYGGTHRILRSLAARGAFDIEFVDLTAPSAAAVVAAKRPRLVWIETPSNPLLRITDLRRVVGAGREAGAIVAVDNTFLSPALQRPLEFGAQVVVHSTTKYLNGHSDVVGGAVVASESSLAEELAWWANCLGLTGAPFDSYLTLRGIRTLHARLRVHCENAERVASALCDHPAVSRVYYPGLRSHPGHALAASQQSGFGAMVSCELRGGVEAVQRFVESLECFSLAESLGGVESLVAHPATMTHASMDAEARARAGIGDGLVRLSVGIEDGSDLVDDLIRALDGNGTAHCR